MGPIEVKRFVLIAAFEVLGTAPHLPWVQGYTCQKYIGRINIVDTSTSYLETRLDDKVYVSRSQKSIGIAVTAI